MHFGSQQIFIEWVVINKSGRREGERGNGKEKGRKRKVLGPLKELELLSH